MEKEPEEMQSINLFEIYLESYKIIFSWRRIFSKITLAFILPLSFIYLAHIEVSQRIFSTIAHDQAQLDGAAVGSDRYRKTASVLSAQWTRLLLFKAAYLTVFVVLSLLATAAVVYTIASVYTGRQFTFRSIIAVVPRVWKRLLVTFLCIFVAFFVYNLVAGIVFIIWAILMFGDTVSYSGGVLALLVVCAVIYFVGLVYMTIVWQLATVVSVLEESYGVAAMRKSRALIRGKEWIAVVIFVKLNLTFAAVQFLFQNLVVGGVGTTMMRGFYGVFCFLLLSKLFLFGLVIQTVFYLVCKSYHNEKIDKTVLSEQLEVYDLGDEYLPLKAKDVQLEHFEV